MGTKCDYIIPLEYHTLYHTITLEYHTVYHTITLECHCTTQYHNSRLHNTTGIPLYDTIPVPVDYIIPLTGTAKGSHAMNETGN